MKNLQIAKLLVPAITASLLILPANEVKAQAIQPTPIMGQVNTQSPPVSTVLLKAVLLMGGSAGVLSIMAAFLFRRVVSTNSVHIVQSGKKTVPYGANLTDGNVYYEIPTWVPMLGVSVIKLPVSNFNLSLNDYEAYDEDRVPFKVDITAFFPN